MKGHRSNEAWKAQFRHERDSYPWALRRRCSVLYQNSCRQLIIFRVHQRPGDLEDKDMKVNDKNIHNIYFYFLSLCILVVSFDLLNNVFFLCDQQLTSKASKPQRSRMQRTANKVDHWNLSTISPGFTLFSPNGFLIDWVSKCSLSNGTCLRKLPIAGVSPF